MTTHASDCAVHNEPALPAGPCNCGALAPDGSEPCDYPPPGSRTSNQSDTPPAEILAELRWTDNRGDLAQIYLRHLAQRAADEIERLRQGLGEVAAAYVLRQVGAPARPFTPDEAKAYRSFIEDYFGPPSPPAATQDDDERAMEIIENLRDALRYRQLRILGCAPAATDLLRKGLVARFTNLDKMIDADMCAHPERGASVTKEADYSMRLDRNFPCPRCKKLLYIADEQHECVTVEKEPLPSINMNDRTMAESHGDPRITGEADSLARQKESQS